MKTVTKILFFIMVIVALSCVSTGIWHASWSEAEKWGIQGALLLGAALIAGPAIFL